MAAHPSFQPEDHFEINPLFKFRWEESQQSYVLLYPEGVVKLNPSAGEILKRCVEGKTVGQIVEELKQQYVDPQIEQSIYRFLEVSHDKGWIRDNA